MPATSASSASTARASENYQLLLGGSGAEDVLARQITGPGFDENGIVDAVERRPTSLIAQRTEGERFLDTYRRRWHGPVQGGDLSAYMRRCGFDSFKPNAPLDDADVEAAFARWPDVYQKTVDGRPPDLGEAA
jgi:hypothetical protein